MLACSPTAVNVMLKDIAALSKRVQGRTGPLFLDFSTVASKQHSHMPQ